jgi:hypothetical protein
MLRCIEHDSPDECEGEVGMYYALSGSGIAYPRCDLGYEVYVARTQPRLDEVNERYPDSSFAPSWFDPTYAGERWDDDY